MNLTKLVTDPRVDALYCTLASFCPLTRTARFAGFLARPHITESRNSGTLTREYSCRNSVRLRSTGFDHHAQSEICSSYSPICLPAISISRILCCLCLIFQGASWCCGNRKQPSTALATALYSKSVKTFNPGFRDVWHCSCSKNR